MSIQVISNQPTQEVKAEAPAVESEAVETKSAPEAKASEQKETTESGTEESEEVENEKDESEESESEKDQDESDKSEKAKLPKKSGFQKRIDKLNARISAKEAEIEHWKREALKQGATESKEPKIEPKATEVQGKPNPEDFDSHVAYVEALTDWKLDQKEKAREEKESKSKLQTEQEKLLETHQSRMDTFADKTEGFTEAIQELVEDKVRLSTTVDEILVSSDLGPALLFELAKNREELKRINSLSPLAAAREMGKLESKILAATSESKPEPKKITSAPKPISPVGSKGGVVEKSLNDPNLSQADFEAIVRQREKRRAAAW